MIKLKTLLTISVLLINTPIWAQYDFSSIGARSSAMGGCFTSLTDYWSNVTNIAGVAFNSHINIGIDYRQNYRFTHHSFKSIAILFPTKETGNIITHYTHYGNNTYNEQLLEMGYAIRINPKIAIGATINYIHSSTSDNHYENINLITFSTGIHIYPNNKLIIGAKVFNPIYSTKNTQTKYHIPTILNIGISYFIIDKLLGSIEFEKNMDYHFITRIGLEYECTKMLYARIGFSSHPNTFGFGLGIKKQRYNIDITVQAHQSLGIAPQISANYKF